MLSKPQSIDWFSMSTLFVKPKSEFGHIHDITPANANWGYVGFGVYRLRKGETINCANGKDEAIIVFVEGKAVISVLNGPVLGELGDRMNVFEKKPPHAVYVSMSKEWTAKATTDCTIGVCRAPGKLARETQIIGPDGVDFMIRGVGTNTREIFNIAMEDRDVADSLLVTEVFTPQGNWSSYPPHRHDEDDYPNITYLEETYYHRLNPVQGFGFQRVFTDDGLLDETMCVQNHDVVLVPKGHHPCGTPFGYEMYYLNVMAGPLRKWRFKTSPQHDWLYEYKP